MEKVQSYYDIWNQISFFSEEDQAWITGGGRIVLRYDLEILRVEWPTWMDIANAAYEIIPANHWDSLFIKAIKNDDTIHNGPSLFTGSPTKLKAFHVRLKDLIDEQFGHINLYHLQGLIEYLESAQVKTSDTLVSIVSQFIRESTRSKLHELDDNAVFHLLYGKVFRNPLLKTVEFQFTKSDIYREDVLEILRDMLYRKVLNRYFNENDKLAAELIEAGLAQEHYNFIPPIWSQNNAFVTLSILIGEELYSYRQMSEEYKDRNVIQLGMKYSLEDKQETIIYQFNLHMYGNPYHTQHMYELVNKIKELAAKYQLELITNSKSGTQPNYILNYFTDTSK